MPHIQKTTSTSVPVLSHIPLCLCATLSSRFVFLLHELVRGRQPDSAAGERGMIASSKLSPAETPFAAKNAEGSDAPKTSDGGTAQRSPNHGSEILCDGAGGPAAGALTATGGGGGGGGVDTACATAVLKNPVPRRRNASIVATKGPDIHVSADSSPAETSAGCVLRPFLIRSLARQKDLNVGVLTQAVMSPPAGRKPAADKLPRRVVVAQESPPPIIRAAAAAAAGGTATKARTARTAAPEVGHRKMFINEALSPASEPLRDGSRSTTTTTHEKISEALEISANDNKDSAGRGWRWCRWAGRLLEGYSEALETRPLTFKCITSALVGALGDVAAQAVFWAIQGGGNAVWHDTKVSP